MPYGASALGQGLRLRSHRERSDRSQGATARVAAIAAVLAALIGFLSSSLRVEALPWLAGATPESAAIPEAASVSGAILPEPRPLALEEQRYADALWSIHAQVEQTIARVGLGAAFYQSQEIDRDELRQRLNYGLAGYRLAETRLLALDPPVTLRSSHAEYVAAVHLFQQSALEMLKMYEDDDEEHLATALPLSLDGTSKLRGIEAQFWPETYPQG
jgi:hypothetical protein